MTFAATEPNLIHDIRLLLMTNLFSTRHFTTTHHHTVSYHAPFDTYLLSIIFSLSTRSSLGDTPLYRCLVEDRQVGSYSYSHSHSLSQGGTGGQPSGGLYDHVESTIPKDTRFQSGSWTRKVSNDVDD